MTGVKTVVSTKHMTFTAVLNIACVLFSHQPCKVYILDLKEPIKSF